MMRHADRHESFSQVELFNRACVVRFAVDVSSFKHTNENNLLLRSNDVTRTTNADAPYRQKSK